MPTCTDSYPNGESHPFPEGGGNGLEWHKGKPGEDDWEGRDHWHRVLKDRRGRWQKDNRHYKPGDEVPEPCTEMERLRLIDRPGMKEDFSVYIFFIPVPKGFPGLNPFPGILPRIFPRVIFAH